MGGPHRWLLALAASAGLVLAAPSAASAACPWVGSTAPVEQRVSAVLAQMTLDEEIALVHGTFPGFYGGYLAPIPQAVHPFAADAQRAGRRQP